MSIFISKSDVKLETLPTGPALLIMVKSVFIRIIGSSVLGSMTVFGIYLPSLLVEIYKLESSNSFTVEALLH